jgi:hypothetical protein
MPGPEIPDTDHVSRLCGGSKCDDDGRPLASAFMLRSDERYLSGNWLEFTGKSSRAEQLAVVRRHLINKDLTLPATGRLAILHLQTVFDHVRSKSLDARELTAHHQPLLPDDPSHAGIYGYTVEDHLIADLIAEAVQESHMARV